MQQPCYCCHFRQHIICSLFFSSYFVLFLFAPVCGAYFAVISHILSYLTIVAPVISYKRSAANSNSCKYNNIILYYLTAIVPIIILIVTVNWHVYFIPISLLLVDENILLYVSYAPIIAYKHSAVILHCSKHVTYDFTSNILIIIIINTNHKPVQIYCHRSSRACPFVPGAVSALISLVTVVHGAVVGCSGARGPGVPLVSVAICSCALANIALLVVVLSSELFKHYVCACSVTQHICRLNGN